MSRPLEEIQTHFNCSILEALSIHKKGKALAAAFTELRRHYSVEHLQRSETLKAGMTVGLQHTLSAREALKLEGGLKYLMERKLQASRINGGLRTMWEAFRTAKRAEQELMFVRNIFDLEIAENSFVTTVLEQLYTVGEMRSPQDVAEGREAYITLVKANGLAHWMGYDTPKQEEIWETHDFYYHH